MARLKDLVLTKDILPLIKSSQAFYDLGLTEQELFDLIMASNPSPDNLFDELVHYRANQYLPKANIFLGRDRRRVARTPRSYKSTRTVDAAIYAVPAHYQNVWMEKRYKQAVYQTFPWLHVFDVTITQEHEGKSFEDFPESVRPYLDPNKLNQKSVTTKQVTTLATYLPSGSSQHRFYFYPNDEAWVGQALYVDVVAFCNGDVDTSIRDHTDCLTAFYHNNEKQLELALGVLKLSKVERFLNLVRSQNKSHASTS